ncbi:BREX-1 system adenine-specific DNA-methyltransferase PglX [Acinetobacter faecalis]|uniref:BREX-1 system adenine-specific DNA-methyltransferase PglX n=1 Tax=Acinetobacter faecalis TaxID=2665161 RepID=UPI002A9192A5|nr:BREX-1 system adenine-specific DNA-methyltransferase PglX [Acinetobacter faecalis]MDY6461973.1 BREX-1 system adenine-specific DNA-methyltransferase PglX [Acinetobacter faecalis]
METAKLKKFAQYARRSLIEQVGSKLAQVLKDESSERRELPNVVTKLESELKQKGKEQLIEQTAYTWFNRFCALRFMDVNQYNRIMVLSPLDGQFQPEILAEAKAGHIDDSVVNDKIREKIFGLLNGSIKSRDGQSEAYRLLIVAVCNDYHRIMPYLFERIEDYMELLMPDDLLSGNSILAYTREAMTPETCESVECIGWLYQFYISEKKDQVFEGLKKNKKITPENIPAATQLFTPHWIVRYLVENSLGRLWMLNNPSSKVIRKMDYYIKPVEEESDFLKISSPEEIKVCDPACGSGHMLTYAYDLLYAIYLDAGYDSIDIPELILTKNLYGIEIDERAAELAAFALSMKALKGNPDDEGNNRRRFFRNPIKPNICRLENIAFNDNELNEYFDFVGRDLFTQDLRATLKEFEEADNFGSLIQPTLANATDVLAILKAKDVSGQLFLAETHQRVLRVINQTDYLSQKYHIVVANPPYMGPKGMNGRLSVWAKKYYPTSKADLYSMFFDRSIKLVMCEGFVSMITMQSWMFISSFEDFRANLLNISTITSMAHLGSKAFDTIGGEVVSTTAFNCQKTQGLSRKGVYLRLVDGRSEKSKDSLLRKSAEGSTEFSFLASANDFEHIPGSPISYWISDSLRAVYKRSKTLSEVADIKEGLSTCNNDLFLRRWQEVSLEKIGLFVKSNKESITSEKKWFPYNKGGEYRKWYGNNEFLVNWYGGGADIHKNSNLPLDYAGAPVRAKHFYFRPSITFSKIATDGFSSRLSNGGFVFDTGGPSIFTNLDLAVLQGFLSSNLCKKFLSVLSPTINFSVGDIKRLPIDLNAFSRVEFNSGRALEIYKADWDSSELSWEFLENPLIKKRSEEENLSSAFESYKKHCNNLVAEAHRIEIQANKSFIETYQVSGEVEINVPLSDITLSCNPKYRYGKSKSDDDVEKLFLHDTVCEFISYSVGCMFGRYSLDKAGLVLANQGDSLEKYLNQIPNPSFLPEDDNIIPIIDFEGDWFEDDMSERFKEFLKVTFGEKNFSENLAFVEDAIGKDIKKYFVKDFYGDHVSYYKKRPIYWLFSSPKGTFNALIYVHRYRSDTVSVVLNDYLREFRTKLQARKESYEQVEVSASASQKDKTDAIKAIDKINKALDEVNDYERDILYPLAGQKIEIDLDDGVKANYPKFGKALKNITGLS